MFKNLDVLNVQRTFMLAGSDVSIFGALLQLHITRQWREKVVCYYTISLFNQYREKQSHSLNAVSEARDQPCLPLKACRIWHSDLFLRVWSTICSVPIFEPHSGNPTTNGKHGHQQARTFKSPNVQFDIIGSTIVPYISIFIWTLSVQNWIHKSEYISKMYFFPIQSIVYLAQRQRRSYLLTLYFNMAYKSIVNTTNKTKNNLICIRDENSDEQKYFKIFQKEKPCFLKCAKEAIY